jgi:hypothetical protein
MVRTVISLDEEDKAWLDRQAARRRVPMTRLIREAVRLLRRHEGASRPSTDDLLSRTQGIWRRGDGLRWQRRLRDEW